MKEWMGKISRAIPGYNCGNMPDRAFIMLFWLKAALFLVSIVWMFPQHFSGTALSIRISAGIFAASVLIGWGFVKMAEEEARPYARMAGYQFLGLHDLSRERLGESMDVIARDEEAENIRDVLEHIIFPQAAAKQALVLVGKSGCGKSTILAFFRQKYGGRDYKIKDFSGNYRYLQSAMEGAFGADIDHAMEREIKKEGKKEVLILDQFERYFFLDGDSKRKVREVMELFGKKDMAVVISMREEYLSVFLKEFDVNDIRAGAGSGSRKGVLRELDSMIKDSSGNVRNKSAGGSGRLSYRGQDCKNNAYMHLECPGFGKHTMVEKRGITVFYCENQNDSMVTMGGGQSASMQIEDKCRKTFWKEKGAEFYHQYEKKPLIEQQIIFHMAEFEQKENGMGRGGLEKNFCRKEEQALLGRYFDRQTAACRDDFNASRILYLLSSAGIKHVSMDKEALLEGLFECQFSAEGGKKVDEVLKKLLEMQLIRRTVNDSDNEYEIAHDFIAESFLNYSSTNINRHVKNALDLYMADYLDGRQEKERKTGLGEEAGKGTYYKTVSAISMVSAAAGHLAERFLCNPFDASCEEMFLFAPVINLLSIWYLYRIYDKFVKFYREKETKIRWCKGMYILIMIAAVGGVLCYPHVLAFDGVSLGLMGLNVAFLLPADQYHEASRKELRSYGLKCSLMGFVYAGFHIGFAVQYPDGVSFMLMVLETTVLWLLVVYAHLVHMTKNFLYSRYMDVSCVKKRGGREQADPKEAGGAG